MKQYLDFLWEVLNHGTHKSDRTGTGTTSMFGHQMRFDLSDGFPLLTTKKVHLKSIIHELLWFLSGSTNIQYLRENGVKIWDDWASDEGYLGPVYGAQWRRWEKTDGRHVDQIAEVVRQLKEDPDSRRIIVSAWNVGDLDKMALPPCHAFFQFWTREISHAERFSVFATKYLGSGLTARDIPDPNVEAQKALFDKMGVPTRKLSCQLYQRSADVFLGVPFNIASYSLLTMMLAQVCGMEPGEFVWAGGDCHVYDNHQEQVALQMTRRPHRLPTMHLNPEVKDIFSFSYEDFTLQGYVCDPAIPAPVAV